MYFYVNQFYDKNKILRNQKTLHLGTRSTCVLSVPLWHLLYLSLGGGAFLGYLSGVRRQVNKNNTLQKTLGAMRTGLGFVIRE